MTSLRVSSAAVVLSLTGLSTLAAQGQSSAQSVARLEISPARREIAVGDSLQLSARALDASGKPIPDATIIFKPEGLAAATVDSTGLVRTGASGNHHQRQGPDPGIANPACLFFHIYPAKTVLRNA